MDLNVQDAIAKYNLPLETPPMDATQLKSSPYVLIRHGLSKFNYAALVAKTEFGEDSPEFKAVQEDPNMIDPELHDVGVKQCEAAHDVVNSIDW